MHHFDVEPNTLVAVAQAAGQETDEPLTDVVLAALLDTNPDGVIALDSDNRACIINRQALHYLNLPGVPEDWLHRSISEIVGELRIHAPEAVDPVRSELQRYGYGDESRGEGEFRTDYGIIRWLNLPLGGMSLPGPLHASAGRLVILCDVTAQRQTATERRDLARLLENDLQEPLGRATETMRYVAACQEAGLSGDSQQALRAAVGETEGALATIRQFIDLGRLQSGQMPLNMSPFQLPDLVDRVLDVEQSAARERALKLEPHVDRSLPPVWGDVELIERVLGNLVSGVLAVTPPGGTVLVEASVPVADQQKIMVSITDSRMGTVGGSSALGAGKLCVYETSPPYHRAGTLDDLSFTFCRKVVEAHGERIWVLNSRSAGTAVTFTLPQVSASLVSVGSPAS